MAATTAPDAQRDASTKERSSESDSTIREEGNMSDREKNAEAGQQPPAPNPASGTPGTPPTPPPPNGGFAAWLQVAASFAVFFNTWGVLNTFGVFQTYYETGVLFTETSSNISWIGSVQSYCLLLVGLVAGPIYDRGYLRALLGVGTFLIVFGFMMLSLCTAYWQAVLAQGFCIGIGAGLIFVPSLAVLPAYFSTRLGLALGLAACGSSFGGVIYPIVFYKLLQQTTFGWAVRAVGFIALATLMVPLLFMRQRSKPAKARDALDWSAFTDFPFAAFTVSTMIGFIGLYVMLFYVSYFALATGATNAEMAFYLVPILNVASMLGRTLPNALSDKVGPLNILAPGAIICGALTYALISMPSLAGIVIITLLYGFFSGVFIALPPVCFVRLTEDKRKVGTRMGMGFATLGFGVLAGGPGGGAILGKEQGNQQWTELWVYGGTMAVGSGVLLLALRMYLTKGKWWVKI
ncbi:major facilitator superfamily transporter monocarboxylate [Cercophora newfieldiana]|uniref:Major facilitator superfamily transporter monocarboxylate n=1 Tax=Cercophora newfieldiana TaxID=92897 RepID=A0AA40CX24_9PEZI|nr:major facilitator superfamily transporter monocarboxylate [Cercophora newfieldiana]